MLKDDPIRTEEDEAAHGISFRNKCAGDRYV